AAELLDQVDDLDRVLAAVVALAPGVEAVGVGLGRVDAGNDEVAAHDRAVLAHVGGPGGGWRRIGGDLRRRFRARRRLVLQLLFFDPVLVVVLHVSLLLAPSGWPPRRRGSRASR